MHSLSAEWTQVLDLVVTYVPKLVAAIVILLIGWAVAAGVGEGVRIGLSKTGLGKRMTRWLGEDVQYEGLIEKRAGQVTFYIVLLLVLVGVFQVLGLVLVTQPLNRFVTVIFAYAPRVLGALLLLLVAWIVASIVRYAVRRGLSWRKLPHLAADQAGLDKDAIGPGLHKTVAEAAYWVIFLLFLPGILNALDLPGLVQPVQAMAVRVLAYLPNLLGAILILLIGWFVARVVQRLLVSGLHAIGLDKVSDRVGLNQVLGQALSVVVGLIAYVLVLIPVFIAALNALKLSSVTAPASHMLEIVLASLPSIFAALLLIAIAFIVGRIISRLVAQVLDGIGFNNLLGAMGLRMKEGFRKPSDIVGYLTLIATILFATLEGLQLLHFSLLSNLIYGFLIVCGHVLAGLIVIGLGLFLARLAATTIAGSAAANAPALAMLSRIAIVAFAIAIGLRQMGVANDIVNLAFALILGAAAVAAAIAFGVGSRNAAARLVDHWAERLHRRGE